MGIRVVPFTRLNPATEAAVAPAEFIEIDGPDDYRLELRRRWMIGEAFTLIEHDVVPTREQLAAIEACERPWCFFGYCPGDWVPTFGCVRFSAELIAGTQGVFDDPSWPWDQLDARFHVEARRRGWEHHWHYPHVHHTRFHVKDARGIETRRELDRAEELHILRAEEERLLRLAGSAA